MEKFIETYHGKELGGVDVQEQVEQLVKKIKARLREVEHSTYEKLMDVDRVLQQLEESYSHFEELSLQDKISFVMSLIDQALPPAAKKFSSFRDRLDATLRILEQKYAELERLDLDQAMDATVDATMRRIEQVDTCITEAIDDIKRAASEGTKRLLKFNELPAEWQHNQYILSGYRFLTSPWQCLASIFYIHNESGNIWSHLGGLIFFVILGVWTLGSPDFSNTFSDRLVIGVFFVAAAKCFVCSTVWHTFCHIAHLKVVRCCLCLDYVGISILVCASVMVTEYYGFYCDDLLRNTYMSGTGILAILGTIVPFLPWFDSKGGEWFRVSFFVSLGATSIIPMLHLTYLRGIVNTFIWVSPVIYSIASYLFGVLFYANHFPERLIPGRFDIFLHSHQVWHLCVCAGVYYHYRASLHFHQQRMEFGCPATNLQIN
ncbi:uncharacterized protein VTP21DRAFT_8587 [Calcarisporiella thermophila]|uniref:uncharacterized protein n=1 Tax=Calcarisporiella thermophila TaxID=911321 RepID=UPI0037430B5C